MMYSKPLYMHEQGGYCFHSLINFMKLLRGYKREKYRTD